MVSNLGPINHIPVERVEGMAEIVSVGDDLMFYSRIRAEFPPLVTALIDHHRAAGGAVNPKVSHQLRIIDTLVRNL